MIQTEVIALLQGGTQGAGMDTVICGVHAANYTSNLTRGFYFQAQSSFIITGLMCATENSGPGYNQSVQVVIFGDSTRWSMEFLSANNYWSFFYNSFFFN